MWRTALLVSLCAARATADNHGRGGELKGGDNTPSNATEATAPTAAAEDCESSVGLWLALAALVLVLAAAVGYGKSLGCWPDCDVKEWTTSEQRVASHSRNRMVCTAGTDILRESMSAGAPKAAGNVELASGGRHCDARP